MKRPLQLLSLAALAVSGLAVAPASAQNPNFAPGDLLLGFRATGGVGSSSTILADIGSTTVLRDATSSIFNLANIGTLLDNTYGIAAGNAIAWYERTDLLFGAAGCWSNQNPLGSLQNGDPEQTLYVTKARPAVATEALKNSTFTAVASSGNMTVAANNMVSLQQTLETTSLLAADVFPTSQANTWEDYNPASGAAFTSTISGGVQQTFSAGNVGTYTVGIAEGALDLYRVQAGANGAFAGQYVSTAAARNGEFQGTIVIDQTGKVSFNVVPEPTSAMLLAMTGLGLLARRRRSLA